MANDSIRRGFVTIATGSEKYYPLAVNLLRSYRLHNTDDTPFAILCDRRHPLTAEFDHVVIMDESTCSYMDKLQLCRWSPYEESMFVDADSLFLKDPAPLWEDFSLGGDFSCYGKRLPLDSPAGWFDHRALGELSKQVSFNISMHGGLYYFRRTDTCREVFTRAEYLSDNFSRFGFRYFEKPADEPVLALAMAAAGWEPCPVKGRIAFVPTLESQLRVSASGTVLQNGKACESILIHFTTGNTRRFMYHYLLKAQEKTGVHMGTFLLMGLRFLPLETAIRLSRVIRRFLPHSLWIRLRQLVK